MDYIRMPIEIEAPEEKGYSNLKYNLTESSYQDQILSNLSIELKNLALSYIDHRGNPKLRELILSSSKKAKIEDVLITPGAAGALFFVANALLDPRTQDEIIVVSPNYGTNLITPKILGVKLREIHLSAKNHFAIDLDLVKNSLNSKTKYVSITNPHNPTGTVVPAATIRSLIALCESHKIPLIIDETYRDMMYQDDGIFWADESPNVITISSLSKTYGVPGIRIGWSICRDPQLNEKFLAVKEQVLICNSVVDEEIARQVLDKKQELLPKIKLDIENRFQLVKTWMKDMESKNYFTWVQPAGGVVCYPKMVGGNEEVWKQFYHTIESKYETFVGPGHWFYESDQQFRLGFGWPTIDELKAGLENLSKARADLKKLFDAP
ncbi:MAG: pyridoxal phosphate-dependent aminotransferase [Bacteriovoracaceae bacterium]|nr:pyridoxal phosphate-dependent aminotransferase [Bacteriovoracaceae bacterium]